MLKHTLVASISLLAMTTSALALNPQPEPPGVQGKVNRVQPAAQGAANRAIILQKPTEAAGSDSGSDSHANPANKATWAAGSDSGNDRGIKSPRTNANVMHPNAHPTLTQGSDSGSEAKKTSGLGGVSNPSKAGGNHGGSMPGK